jgi:hypothetical protein
MAARHLCNMSTPRHTPARLANQRTATECILSGAALVVVPRAARLVPLRAALALCDRWPSYAGVPFTPGRLARRVRDWFGPDPSRSLARSLVLYTLLRQHGYAPRLHVADAAGNTAAQAWVTLGGRVVA